MIKKMILKQPFQVVYGSKTGQAGPGRVMASRK